MCETHEPLKASASGAVAMNESTRLGSRAGVSLVEVAVAMALAGLLTAGLFTLGVSIQRQAEHTRIATEARSLGKEQLEEIYAMRIANLLKPTCTVLNGLTNTSTIFPEYTIVRTPRAVWHNGGGSVVTQAVDAVYAEVHVDVRYWSPLFKRDHTDTYTMLVAE